MKRILHIVILWVLMLSSAYATSRTVTFSWPQPMTYVGMDWNYLICSGTYWFSMASDFCETHSRTVEATADISKSGWALVYVDSEQTTAPDNMAIKAFDGNNATFWHTKYSPTTDQRPHEIQIDLGTTYNINGFKYLPRQDGSVNGTITTYEFYVSSSTSAWGSAVSTGTFSSGMTEKTITFTPISGRYVRLKATGEINNAAWTSAAEISVTQFTSTTQTCSTVTECGVYEPNPPTTDLDRWELLCGQTDGGPYTLQQTLSAALYENIALTGWTSDGAGTNRYHATLATAPAWIERSGAVQWRQAYDSKTQLGSNYYVWYWSDAEDRLYFYSTATVSPSGMTYTPAIVSASMPVTFASGVYYCVVEGVRATGARSGPSNQVLLNIPDGGAIAGGTSPVVRTKQNIPTGGAIAGGTSPYFVGNADYAAPGTGGAIAGGTSPVIRTKQNIPAGGAVAGGTSPYTFYDIDASNTSYAATGTGGAIAGGTSPGNTAKLNVSTGGAVAGGTSPYSTFEGGAASITLQHKNSGMVIW